jgi:hypothetical protein
MGDLLVTGGFFFWLWRLGKLLFLRLALRSWRSRSTKSGGPAPLTSSLNVQGDDTHNNSRFDASIVKQFPEVVRMGVGTTVL